MIKSRVSRPRRLTRKAMLLVAIALAAISGAAGVLAYFLATGTALANGSVGSVNPPTSVVAKAANGSTSLGASPITITWTAPASGATPTGYQVKRDNGSTQTTLSCSASPCTDSTVPDGVYAYHVKSLFGSTWTSTTADSNSITVQNQVSTTTTLASSSNPSVVGETVTYTATVSAGAVVPGGTVDFKDGTTTVCSAKSLTASSPYRATCQQTYAAPSAGHSMTAVYSGDAGTLGSTSSALSQVVNKAATSTTVASSANPSVVGQLVTYTATVSLTAPGSATLTGTVDFKDGSSIVCSAKPLSGSAPFTATCQQTYNTVSAGHSITAVYGGDGNTAGSSSSALSQVVNAAATTTTLASGINPSVFGQSVTFSVTVSANAPGGGTPTGTVAVKEASTTICIATLSSGAGSCSSSSLSVATHSLTATYAGTASFSTSTSSPGLSQVVNPASTSTVVASGTNPSVTGQSVTFTATVSTDAPGNGTPTGTVNFTDNGTTITGCGAKPLNGSGQATCSTSFSAANGNRSIVATYSNVDGSFNGSTAAGITQTVNAANTTTTLTSGTNPTVTGQTTLLTGTVAASAPGSGTPSGSIEFLDGATPIAACGGASGIIVNGSGVATCSPSFTATGSAHSLTAKYLATTAYNTSTSSAVSQTVNAAGTTTTLTSGTNPTVTGQNTLLTGTVTANAPGSGTPSGNVEFLDGATPIAACGGATGTAVNGSGVATCNPSFAATGSAHSLTAKYLVTTAYNTSTSSAVSQTVNAANTTTTLTSGTNPTVTGQTTLLTGTVVASAPGTGTPSGSIEFFDGATPIAACGGASGTALNASGGATCSPSFTATGSAHSLTAKYLVTTAYNTSTSSAVSQTVTQAATTTAVVSGTNPSVTGTSVTFTATVTVTSPGAGTPTGTVTFKDGGSTITCSGGTQTVNGSGQATCSTSALTTGSHTITAVYSGDTSFSTSTSAGLTQSVNIFAGIDWVNSGASGSGFSCDYTSITSVACTINGLGNGDTIKGTVRLISSSHTAVTNTGSSISVAYGLTGQAGSLSPASPQSIANGASATPTIQYTMNNGSNKTAVLTATVTLNGATYTVTLTTKS